jgi:hypothetical protein
MKVTMKNPKTGEIKEIKVGWSWTLFLFSGLFGLPLFLKKLNLWGSIFFVMWIINLIVPSIVSGDEGEIVKGCILFIFIGLQVFVGVKGNEMIAKNYLEKDWTFVDPDSELTKMAKMKWGIYI